MALAQDDIEQIQQLIEQSWVNNKSSSNDNIHYELDIRERIVRVEEELKNQRDLLIQSFKQSDKRFEQVDKRFEEIQRNMDKRFEQVDKRFESMQETMNNGFKEVIRRMDRFMFWSLGITITTSLFVVTYLK